MTINFPTRLCVTTRMCELRVDVERRHWLLDAIKGVHTVSVEMELELQQQKDDWVRERLRQAACRADTATRQREECDRRLDFCTYLGYMRDNLIGNVYMLGKLWTASAAHRGLVRSP